MRPKLLASTIIVVTFWFVATTLYWSFQKPEVNYQSLLALASFAQSIGLGAWVNSMSFEPSIMASLGVQKVVLLKWTLPVLILAIVSAGIGFGVTWRTAYRSDKERTEREAGSGNFRGVTNTKGRLPLPKQYPMDEVELSTEDATALQGLSEPELKLLNEVMGTISANEGVAALPTGVTSLVDFTLGKLSGFFREVEAGPIEYFGLTTIAVAAIQLGYINAYQKGPDKKSWIANGNKTHEGEAGAILTAMPAWFELPYLERQAVYLAVKYNFNAAVVPHIQGDETIAPVARTIINQSQAFGIVALNLPPKVEIAKKEEKVIKGDQFTGPSAYELEDKAYVLPGQADEERSAADADFGESSVPGGAPLGAIQTPAAPAPAPAPVSAPVSPPVSAPAPVAPVPAAAQPAPVSPPAPVQAAAPRPAPAPAEPARPEESQQGMVSGILGPATKPRPPAPAQHATPAATAQPNKPAPAQSAPAQKPAQKDGAQAREAKGAPAAAVPGIETVIGPAMQKEIFDTFIRILPKMAFQDRGLPKSVKAVAWKVQFRVFMLEIQLRERLMEALPEHIREKIMSAPRNPKVRAQPLTQILLYIFEQKGWLITEINGTTVSNKEAFWNIHAGTMDFKGVIVLDIPEEYRARLPERDSMYSLKVTGPLWTSSSTGHKRAPEAGRNEEGGKAPNRPSAKHTNTTSMVDLRGILG